MMSFCKRSVHSFLGTNDNGSTILKPQPRSRNISSPIDGLSLIAVTGDTKKPSHVLESTILNSTYSFSSTSGGSGSVSGAEKKDPCGFGFIDEIGGGVDGLMSCTESLGFESSDERRTDEQLNLIEMNEERGSELCSTRRRNQCRKRIKVRSEPKSFPPPLSSLKQNGQPSFYLRPVRKDGRLELTEVRIDRTEILHASRHDGRLRLHFILDDIPNIEEDEDEEIDEKIEEENAGEERESTIGEWKLLEVTNDCGGDGFRRCFELHNHHHNHHNNLHAWSQHCVTTG